jgi:peptide/nickel transport system substrate-binding protein
MITAVVFSLAVIPKTAATGLSDIAGHWAENSINALLEKNLVSGYPDGTFKPDNLVTRAEFLKILTSVLNIPPATGGTSQFSDVTPEDWFFGYVLAAVEKGIVSGYPDGTFKPNNPITREEAAKIVVKAEGIDETQADPNFALSWLVTDGDQVADWARPFVAAAVENELMTGDPTGAFRPTAQITRAETVTIGYRMLPVKATGTFIFGRGADSVILDPSHTDDNETARVTEQIYDTLTELRGGTTLIKPGLAKSWEVSSDNLTWTFHLRKGVKFHDGTDLNADAVLFNFERWWDKDNPYHKGVFPTWEVDFGGYKGDESCTIDKFEKVDDYTFRIVLKQPFAPLLATLAEPWWAISSPTAIKNETPENYATSTEYPPVGTGPFKFVEWVKDDRIVLEPNPDYWGEKAKVEKVIIKVIPDNSARYLALKTGEIMGMEGANPDDAKAAKNEPNLQVLLRPALNAGWLDFMVSSKPFDDVRVRKAVAMAIDKKAIVQAIYGENGVVANQLRPPSAWGRNNELQDYPYDPEGAKALLAEAGYPDGFETDFWYMSNPRPYYPDPKGVAEAVAADLAKIGVRCNLKTEDWATYIADMRDGKFNLWMIGGTADNGDPDNLFSWIFLVPRPQFGNYNNPELIKILTEARTITTQAQREKLYEQAAAIIHDDCPMIYMAHNQVPLLFSKKVSGYVVNPCSTEIYNSVVLLP